VNAATATLPVGLPAPAAAALLRDMTRADAALVASAFAGRDAVAAASKAELSALRRESAELRNRIAELERKAAANAAAVRNLSGWLDRHRKGLP
jgi:hypothetical protein